MGRDILPAQTTSIGGTVEDAWSLPDFDDTSFTIRGSAGQIPAIRAKQ
jgi:hypothetical protein